MKACPLCKRTYDDETLNFCLADGSLLSDDSDETLTLVAARNTDPGLTPPTLSTLQSPQAPSLYPEKPGGNPWMVFSLAISLVSLLVVGGLLSFIWFGKDQTTGNQTNSNGAKANTSPTASPTATKENSIWEPIQQASINQGDGQLLTYYRGTTPEQCQADCAKNPGCKAFTFIKPGAYNPNDPQMCYLMSRVERLTPSPCCISAIKR
jgi:hypothetical protein